jgi:hypothetical protein
MGSDPLFSGIIQSIDTLANLIKRSRQELADSGFDLPALFRDRLGKRFLRGLTGKSQIRRLNDMGDIGVNLEVVKRMTIDLAKAATLLSFAEVRYLVDDYYRKQENRIRDNGQVRALRENEEPHAVIEYVGVQEGVLESQIRRALDHWTDGQHMGRWAKAICGIGPVISAGLLAHIDITKAPTAGHIWRFAGLDPTLRWEKKQKRPFNAQLKTLCAYKLGESFVMVQNNKKDVYGRLFAERKRAYLERNEAGAYAERSKAILEKKKFGKDTEAFKWYSQGKFPPAHIHAMARRYAVKIFLSHYHAEAYRNHYHHEPPKPYAIAILGHAHEV